LSGSDAAMVQHPRPPLLRLLRRLLLGLALSAWSTLARQMRSAATVGYDSQFRAFMAPVYNFLVTTPTTTVPVYSFLVTTTTTTAPGRYVFMDQYKNVSFLGNPIDGIENVKCGSHYAVSCSACPKGHGSEWCNADCKWDDTLGCVNAVVDIEAHELTTTTTTTGHVEDNHAQDVNYTLIPGQHCGGTPILTWAAGGPTSYGLGYASNLAGCELTCALHGDCSGFTVRHSDHMCSLWSMGVLQPYNLTDHDCHQKIRTDCPAEQGCPVCIECPALPPGVTTTQCPTTTSRASSVKCGSHYAESCDMCPQGHGATWCAGECSWDSSLGCIHKTADPNAETTTTTPAVGLEFEQPYVELKGSICGGASLSTWLKGGNSHWGEGYSNNIDGCKKTCALHADCLGFSYRHSDHQCSLWATGTLSPHPVQGYDCFRKVVDIRCPHIMPCAPCPVCGQVCDVTVEDKLIQTMSIENVDFAALKAASVAMGAFEKECTNVLAKNAGVDISAVVVSLAAGSVSVRGEISPPPGMDCEQLLMQLGQNEGLGAALVSGVGTLEGMDSFTTGPMVAGAILSSVEAVMVSASDPCSVQDGSGGSDHYPCNCGGKTCLVEEICNATNLVTRCMGIRTLLKESAVVEMAEWQFEIKLRETRRMMTGLNSEVGRISQELMDAAQHAADTGAMARGNAETLRERMIDANELDKKLNRYNKSIKPMEDRLNADELGNISKVAKGMAINYTWAKIGMENLTDLPVQVSIGRQAIDAYKAVLEVAVHRTMDEEVGTEFDDMVHVRQETFQNLSTNVYRNRSLRGGNDQGGGWPVAPREPLEQIRPCETQ